MGSSFLDTCISYQDSQWIQIDSMNEKRYDTIWNWSFLKKNHFEYSIIKNVLKILFSSSWSDYLIWENIYGWVALISKWEIIWFLWKTVSQLLLFQSKHIVWKSKKWKIFLIRNNIISHSFILSDECHFFPSNLILKFLYNSFLGRTIESITVNKLDKLC